MNENLPNGLSQMHVKQSTVLSRHFNGLGSANSSRDPSPSTRYQQIPSAQLPPSRTGIPSSQLPPPRSQATNINQLTQNYPNLNVSGLSTTNLTPFSSPKIQLFSTSTPVIENNDREVTGGDGDPNAGVMNIKKNVLSPIASNTLTASSKQTLESKEQTLPVAFTHSATSQFTNVTYNTLSDSNNLLLSEKKDVSTSKPDENVQKTFDSNLFTSVGPTLSSGKSMEQLGSSSAKSIAFKPSNQSQVMVSSSQSSLQAIQQITSIQQSPILQGNFHQKPITVSQNTFQNESSIPQQINNAQPLNFASTHPGQTFSLHQPHNIPNQTTSTQNYPQNQFNALNRQKMHPSLSQPRLNMPSMAPPVGMQRQQTSQIPPNSLQAQYTNSQNFGSMPNLQKPNLPAYSQGSPQIPPQISTQNVSLMPPQGTNQNLPLLNQNLPASAIQNQSRAHLHNNRYPFQQVSSSQSTQSFQQQQTPQPPPFQYSNNQQPMQQFQYSNTQQTQPVYSHQMKPNVTQSGFNKLWGRENYDLLQSPNILPQTKLEPPKVSLGQDFLDAVNCSPDIFRCTMTKIPETMSLLQKSRLPLGVLIHPFKDLNHLPVIQCNTIVRCRACRTYINPFVYFADSKRWKCNLCYRLNDLPDEFQFDPVSKTYGDPSRRPEVKSSTIEYIAPAEYMLRPPQPAVYLFLMDVSRLAVQTGYLHSVCNILSSELSNLPGDARTQIGFLAYDSTLHFYSLSEGQSQPHEMTVLDIDDVFLPCPDNLLVNLQDRMEMISDLLTQLPTRYLDTYETNSALGAALQVGYKMMSATGGRITVFQSSLPNIGPGALIPREDPNQRTSSDITHLNPANDFYKRLALECSGQQIAVDLFVLNSQYVDLATISGISRFSGGCIFHFPLFKASRVLQNDAFERCFRRYITRKIGFEAVMRIRCTRGLSIHTFHGNFFVRSTDLLSLPNINPDAGFGMQVSIEENLTDVQTVCFQAALLYTSSKGERRIRVHTMCLPVANNLTDVINSADQQCIVGLLSKMAVDRSMQSSLADAREAFLNVAIDILSSYKLTLNMGSGVSGLMAPECLKLLALYISALLKNISFRIGISTRLDDRVKGMCDMKTKPLPYLIQLVYPDLYPVHNLEEHSVVVNEDDETIHQPPHLQLTARSLDSNGAYLLDMGEHMILFVCVNVSPTFLNNALDVADFNSISDEFYELPLLENQHSKRLHSFVNYLNDEKPFQATFQVVRENGPQRVLFYERLVEDRLENSLSYHEFLQHIKTQVK